MITDFNSFFWAVSMTFFISFMYLIILKGIMLIMPK